MPHFEKTSFRVKNRIFLTLDKEGKLACVKLSLKDQDLFSSFDKGVVYPVPNKWALQGYTFINLEKIDKETFEDLVLSSYCEVAPGKLSAPYKNRLLRTD